MGKYAREPDNAAKSCKSRGSHLRVHFKVSKLWFDIVQFLFGELLVVRLNVCAMCLTSSRLIRAHTMNAKWNEKKHKVVNEPFETWFLWKVLIAMFILPPDLNFRTPMKLHRPSKRCHFVVPNVFWRTLSKRRSAYHTVISMVVLVVALKPNNGAQLKDVGQRNQPISCCNSWKTPKATPNTKAWMSIDWSSTTFW